MPILSTTRCLIHFRLLLLLSRAMLLRERLIHLIFLLPFENGVWELAVRCLLPGREMQRAQGGAAEAGNRVMHALFLRR